MEEEKMSKYINSDKLLAEIQGRKQQDITMRERSILIDIETAIIALQQKQTNGVGGVVHHALGSHWIDTDGKQLATILKEFPEGAEVELFICAKREEE